MKRALDPTAKLARGVLFPSEPAAEAQYGDDLLFTTSESTARDSR